MNNNNRLNTNEPVTPVKAKVTMYNVGFGDSFLFSVFYNDNTKRHVLIDCGSTSEKKDHMDNVVDQISADCGGHLDAIVATHRHKDHISAFGLKEPGKKLKNLKPD
ncbi:MAG: hypothetical protein GY757_25250, partial [bacterium]|nr:hypothetical protein [bacterium]